MIEDCLHENQKRVTHNKDFWDDFCIDCGRIERHWYGKVTVLPADFTKVVTDPWLWDKNH